MIVVSFDNNTSGVASGTGTANLSGTPVFSAWDMYCSFVSILCSVEDHCHFVPFLCAIVSSNPLRLAILITYLVPSNRSLIT